MQEIWKDIKGFEGYYQVSNLGRIKSFVKENPVILQGSTRNNGRQDVKDVNLLYYQDGKKYFKRYQIHRLVAQAFLDFDIKSNLNVYHSNGNTLDNRADNLRIGTPKEKTQKSIENGLFKIREEKRLLTIINSNCNFKKKVLLGHYKRINANKNNKSSNYAGIIRKDKKYVIVVTLNKKHIYLGTTETLKEALKLRKDGLEKYHQPIINKIISK